MFSFTKKDHLPRLMLEGFGSLRIIEDNRGKWRQNPPHYILHIGRCFCCLKSSASNAFLHDHLVVAERHCRLSKYNQLLRIEEELGDKCLLPNWHAANIRMYQPIPSTSKQSNISWVPGFQTHTEPHVRYDRMNLMFRIIKVTTHTIHGTNGIFTHRHLRLPQRHNAPQATEQYSLIF